MGLGGNTIKTWDEIRIYFLIKYREYGKAMDLREIFFRMTQKEYESLEDYLERFMYNI
jgi:hypothetical protein